jgi:hypothetical protein
MKTASTLLAIILIASYLHFSGKSAKERGKEKPFYLGGIQIHEADHPSWFDALESQGMNTVQVTEYAHQGDWDSDNLFWDEDRPWVVKEIQGAKKRGLSVVFIARVAIDHAFPRNAFIWHGMIQPKDDALLDAWFERYRRFTLKWATICEREGVDIFMVGSEMNALASTLPVVDIPPLENYYLDPTKQIERRVQVLAQQRLVAGRDLGLPDTEKFSSAEAYIDARIAKEKAWAELNSGNADPARINARRAKLQQHWQRLIAEVRGVFSGKLGYAANFDQYHEVGFWPALDFMGINAYFKLRQEVLPDTERNRLLPLLIEGWRSVFADIEKFRAEQKLDLPLMFTEMGYTYRAESTLEPWSDAGFSLIQSPTRLPSGELGKPQEHLLVWRDQEIDLEERALAVRALHSVHGALARPILQGILYWKLSSHDYHLKNESFMVHIGPGTQDPILPELRRFLPTPQPDL